MDTIIIIGSVVGGVFFVAMLVVVLLTIFSSKFRGKMMSKQVKATKYMMDESKNDIQSVSTDMAEATADATEIKVRAIKKGFTSEESIFCKYCGQKIAKDSKFCSKCGKEL